MTRTQFEEKMDTYGFKKIFESSYETVWKSGKNQIELLADGTILLARSDCMALNFNLNALQSISERENTYPETLVLVMAGGVKARIEYKR